MELLNTTIKKAKILTNKNDIHLLKIVLENTGKIYNEISKNKNCHEDVVYSVQKVYEELLDYSENIKKGNIAFPKTYYESLINLQDKLSYFNI